MDTLGHPSRVKAVAVLGCLRGTDAHSKIKTHPPRSQFLCWKQTHWRKQAIKTRSKNKFHWLPKLTYEVLILTTSISSWKVRTPKLGLRSNQLNLPLWKINLNGDYPWLQMSWVRWWGTVEMRKNCEIIQTQLQAKHGDGREKKSSPSWVRDTTLKDRVKVKTQMTGTACGGSGTPGWDLPVVRTAGIMWPDLGSCSCLDRKPYQLARKRTIHPLLFLPQTRF